jgi:hypothetical protein
MAMRVGWASLIVGLNVALAAATAQAQQPYLKGNDTGGIISWSCEAEVVAPALAADHCARFDKYARITSVHRHYGDYIAFQCIWTPHVGRFQLPPVRTRTACAARAYEGPTIRTLD